MKSKFLFATAIIFALGLGTADAQIRKTNRNQNTRIKNGVKSGELTKAETKNILHDKKEIHQDVKAAKADGIVTPGEKKEIRQDQRQTSRKIYRKKHNERERN